jgi:hypothetical protein
VAEEDRTCEREGRVWANDVQFRLLPSNRDAPPYLPGDKGSEEDSGLSLAWFDNERHHHRSQNCHSPSKKFQILHVFENLLVRISVNILSPDLQILVLLHLVQRGVGLRRERKATEDMANALIRLPPEIVHNILKYVNPVDLARIAKTCRMLHRSIMQDRLLCKEIWCLSLVSRIVSFALVSGGAGTTEVERGRG